jgi:ribosome-associated protein
MLRVSSSCSIPLSELRIDVSRSTGPGGQHVNTTNSRVQVTFDIANSPSLGPRQRARLLEKLGPKVQAVASDERSQLRNKEVALDRMRAKLAAALHIEKPRLKTRATKASKERRLDAKRRTSQIKARRQGRLDD